MLHCESQMSDFLVLICEEIEVEIEYPEQPAITDVEPVSEVDNFVNIKGLTGWPELFMKQCTDPALQIIVPPKRNVLIIIFP